MNPVDTVPLVHGQDRGWVPPLDHTRGYDLVPGHPHLEAVVVDHRAGDRAVVWKMHETDPYLGVPARANLRVDRFKTVIAGRLL